MCSFNVEPPIPRPSIYPPCILIGDHIPPFKGFKKDPDKDPKALQTSDLMKTPKYYKPYNGHPKKMFDIYGNLLSPGDPSLQIIATLGPKVSKYYLHWAIWIPRETEAPTGREGCLHPLRDSEILVEFFGRVFFGVSLRGLKRIV